MNAIDTVVKPDENGRWIHSFTVRNKHYTMVPGGPSTIAGDSVSEYALFRVWNGSGKSVNVKIRSGDMLTNLDYRHFWEV